MYKMYKLSDRPLTLNIGIVRSLATHREKKRAKERKRDKKVYMYGLFPLLSFNNKNISRRRNDLYIIISREHSDGSALLDVLVTTYLK